MIAQVVVNQTTIRSWPWRPPNMFEVKVSNNVTVDEQLSIKSNNQCTRYIIMWQSLSVTCGMLVVFSGYSHFPLPKNSSSRYNWNMVESGIKHHNWCIGKTCCEYDEKGGHVNTLYNSLKHIQVLYYLWLNLLKYGTSKHRSGLLSALRTWKKGYQISK
jgi:hypothetical protein